MFCFKESIDVLHKAVDLILFILLLLRLLIAIMSIRKRKKPDLLRLQSTDSLTVQFYFRKLNHPFNLDFLKS